MPIIRDVTAKFEKFLDELHAPRQSLQDESEQYEKDIEELDSAAIDALRGLYPAFEEQALKRLQGTLDASGASIDLIATVQDIRQRSAENARRIAEINTQYGTPEALASQIANKQAQYEHDKDVYTTRYYSHAISMTRSEIQRVSRYNARARENKLTPITPENVDDLRYSIWKRMKDGALTLLSALGDDDTDRAIIAKSIRRYPPGAFAEELKQHEEKEAALEAVKAVLDETNLELGRLQGAQSAALQTLQDNIDQQVEKLDNTIRQIEKPLQTLRRRSSVTEVKIDLQAIEKQIKEGREKLDLYARNVDEHRSSVRNYKPASTEDYSLLTNYSVLHILLMSGGDNHHRHPDGNNERLSAEFSSAAPDVTALDIANLDLDKAITGGIDMGVLNTDIIPDIGSSLSGLSGTGHDNGGGSLYDGGSSPSFSGDSGGF